MKRILFLTFVLFQTLNIFSQNSTYRVLNPEEKRVILHKGTEAPFTGKYDDFYEDGVYVCKQCGAKLYYSSSKFDAHCGWPAFDDEIKGAVKRTLDPDGYRTEISCANCGAHLGHVFLNEGFTPTNTRHCVNSISMVFIPKKKAKTQNKIEKAYFAEGCFWGTEYWMEKQKGVISAVSGYAGGKMANPSYYQVSTGNTGYVETVEVSYNPNIISYEELLKVFFNTHDFTQIDGQGPDIGNQYLSVIFDPYFTTKHQSQGTGLGLHMSKKIIEESLNGILDAKNSENGAIFTITLFLKV